MSRHILITGGAGFIGSHLAEHHLARGDQVYVVDNLSTGSLANLKPFRGNSAFRFTEADILRWNDLGGAVAGPTRIRLLLLRQQLLTGRFFFRLLLNYRGCL